MPHVAIPPSTIAEAANTRARTTRPSWRKPASARHTRAGNGTSVPRTRLRGVAPRRKKSTQAAVAEVEGALDVDGRDRPRAPEEAEDDERRDDRAKRGGHGAVWHGGGTRTHS